MLEAFVNHLESIRIHMNISKISAQSEQTQEDFGKPVDLLLGSLHNQRGRLLFPSHEYSFPPLFHQPNPSPMKQTAGTSAQLTGNDTHTVQKYNLKSVEFSEILLDECASQEEDGLEGVLHDSGVEEVPAPRVVLLGGLPVDLQDGLRGLVVLEGHGRREGRLAHPVTAAKVQSLNGWLFCRVLRFHYTNFKLQ